MQIPFKAEYKANLRGLMRAADKAGLEWGRSRLEAAGGRRSEFLRSIRATSSNLSIRSVSELVLPYAEVVRFYDQWAEELTDERYAETVRRAHRSISRGIEEGYSLRDSGWDKDLGQYTQRGVVSLLGEEFGDDKTDHELERIAVTEHTRATNMGAIRAYSADPLVRGVVFVAIDDSRTSDVCRFLDGVRIDIDDPRLQSVSPPLHVNCRSILEPLFVWDDGEIDFDEPQTRQLGIIGSDGAELMAEYEYVPSQVRRDFRGGEREKALDRSLRPPKGWKPKTREQAVAEAIDAGDKQHANYRRIVRWQSVLSNAERRAVFEWTASESMTDAVHSAQIGEGSVTPEVQDVLDHLDSALSTAPVYEGETFRGLHDLADETMAGFTTAGEDIELQALSSFSKSRAVAERYARSHRGENNIVLRVAKPRRHGADIQALSASPEEQEVVVSQDAAYRVTSAEQAGDYWLVDIEEQP